VRCTTKRRWFLTLYTVPADWLRHSPPEMVAQHLNVDEATISKWPSNRPLINARVIEPGALYCCLPRSPCRTCCLRSRACRVRLRAPGHLVADEAAAPQSSLAFMFWGEGLFVFALMLLYTIISYSIFRGKVASLPHHY
jgi:hypothetical protein